MLNVTNAWERALHAPAKAIDSPGGVIIIRGCGSYHGRQGMSLATGVSSRSAGARALCLHVVTIPPGTRGAPHVHEGHESAIYTVSGETEVWHGEGLRQRSVVKAGDFMYVPPGTPHLPVNRSDVMTVAVVARTDPQEQESVVTLALPPHLAELNTFPVAAQLPSRASWPGAHGYPLPLPVSPGAGPLAPRCPPRERARVSCRPAWPYRLAAMLLATRAWQTDAHAAAVRHR